LDSWKEIAAHLGRSVQTAQRWEKREGLPIRRHAHERQDSVYAFRSELDGWRQARDARVAAVAGSEPTRPLARQARRPSRRLLVAGMGIALVAVTAAAL